MQNKPILTLAQLKREATAYANALSQQQVKKLYGTTDGKAVGTYVEIQFREFLGYRYKFSLGNVALGIDFPSLNTDLKVTSINKPQSSCPYRDAGQKVYGLGYHLLVMVYDKVDDDLNRTARLNIEHLLFIPESHTADYQTTNGILGILSRGGNEQDIEAFLEERNLPLDDIGRAGLAQRILSNPPQQGYLTVSNALQWRLQYGRAIELAVRGSGTDLENLLAQ